MYIIMRKSARGNHSVNSVKEKERLSSSWWGEGGGVGGAERAEEVETGQKWRHDSHFILIPHIKSPRPLIMNLPEVPR